MAYKKKWNKNYQKKSHKELQEELDKYMNNALEDIKNHINDPKDVIELANFMSSFYNYSPNNMKLIHEQFPGAQAIASAPTFFKQGFYINKGEKAIRIFAPTPVKYFTLPDGTKKKISEATTEEKARIKRGELELKQVMRYKLVPVFDMTQTNATAEDFPKIFPNRRYDFDFSSIQNVENFKKATEKIGERLNVFINDMNHSETGISELGSAKGMYVEATAPSGEIKREIVMNSRFSIEEQIPTLIHELSHASLHKREAMMNREVPLTASTMEFQAELTSYIVCKHFGIDTSEEAIPYISNWTKNGEKIEDKVNTIDEIHELSRDFIIYMEKELELLDSDLEVEVVEKLESTIDDKESKKEKEVKEDLPTLTKDDFSVGVKIGKVNYEGLENVKEQYEIELGDTESVLKYEDNGLLETNTFRVMVENDGSITIYEAATDEWFVSDEVTHMFDTAGLLKHCQENHMGDATPEYITYLEREEAEKILDTTENFIEDNRKAPEGKEQISYKRSSEFEEEKEKAKAVDIVEFAEKNGFKLKKEGRNQYRDTTHSSMVFIPRTNSFHYNAEEIHGDTITFAQKMLGIDNFKEAVQYINDGEYGAAEIKEIKKEPYVYNPSNEVIDFSKARNYLVNERKIDPDIVDCLNQKGLIRQDKRNNVLFLWNDKGNVVGCSEQGTVKGDKFSRGSWKKIQANSAGDKGFNFKNGSPKNLKFFESSIDCLSYVSLNKNNMKDTWFISMEGLKDSAVKYYASEAKKITNGNVESISLCVDNDKGGQNFVDKFRAMKLKQEGKAMLPFKAEYPAIPYEKVKEVDGWDWNNQIVFQAEKREKLRKKNKETALEM